MYVAVVRLADGGCLLISLSRRYFEPTRKWARNSVWRVQLGVYGIFLNMCVKHACDSYGVLTPDPTAVATAAETVNTAVLSNALSNITGVGSGEASVGAVDGAKNATFVHAEIYLIITEGIFTMLLMAGFLPIWNFLNRIILPNRQPLVGFRQKILVSFVLWVGFLQGLLLLLIFSL